MRGDERRDASKLPAHSDSDTLTVPDASSDKSSACESRSYHLSETRGGPSYPSTVKSLTDFVLFWYSHGVFVPSVWKDCVFLGLI